MTTEAPISPVNRRHGRFLRFRRSLSLKPSSAEISSQRSSTTSITSLASMQASSPLRFRFGSTGYVTLSFEHDVLAQLISITVKTIGTATWKELKREGMNTTFVAALFKESGSNAYKAINSDKHLPSVVLALSQETLDKELLIIRISQDDFQAETFLRLRDVVTPAKLGTDQLHLLQPAQVRRNRTSKWLRSRWTSQDDADDDVQLAAMLAWLNQRTEQQEGVDSVTQRFLDYRDRSWSECLPEGVAFEDEYALLEAAIWELFTSEIGHMTSLVVVRNAFMQPLAEMQHVGHRHDARIPKDVTKISAHKLFGNLEALHRVSLNALLKLEEVLIHNPTRLHQDGCSLAEVTAAALDLAQLQGCLQDMHAAIMMPELAYRLSQPAALDYLDMLLAETNGTSPQAIEQSWTSIAAAYIRWGEEDPRCSRHSLKDLLTQPLQRLMRYPLLLSAVVKQAEQCSFSPLATRDLQDFSASLTRSIEAHNEHVYHQQTLEQLEALDLRLRWPSATDLAIQHGDATCYVPAALRSNLATRPVVNLALLWQQMDRHLGERTDTAGTGSGTRAVVHMGWLSTVTSSGRIADDVFIVLLGHCVLMCKISQSTSSSKRNTVLQRVSSTATSEASSRRSSCDSALSTESDPSKAAEPPLLLQDRPYDVAEVEIHANQPDMPSSDFFLMLKTPLGHPYRSWCLRASSEYQCRKWVQTFEAAQANISPQGSMEQLLPGRKDLQPRSPSMLRARRGRSSAVSFDSRAESLEDLSTGGWSSPQRFSRTSVQEAATALAQRYHSSGGRSGQLSREAAYDARERSGSPLRVGHVSRSSSRTTGYHSNSDGSFWGSSASLSLSEAEGRNETNGGKRPTNSRSEKGTSLRIIGGSGRYSPYFDQQTPPVVRPKPKMSPTDDSASTLTPIQSPHAEDGDATPKPRDISSDSKLQKPSSSSSEEFDSLFDLSAGPLKSNHSSSSEISRHSQCSSTHNSSDSILAPTSRRNRALSQSHSSSGSGGRSTPVDFALFPTDSQLELQLLELSYAEPARQRVRRVNSMRRATSANNSRGSSPQPACLGRASRGSSMAKLRRSTSLRLRQRAATIDTSSLESLAGRARTTSATELMDGLRDTVV
eukprot:m.175479 g.175479  ORF g.175479 m.175479 type:complete len:1114 (-) comp16781_c0_seq2:74-3415(-)